MKILFISKDKSTKHNTFLVQGLKSNGFLFDVIDDSNRGLLLSQCRDYDLIMVEDTTSVRTGRLISGIREHSVTVPVILLLQLNNIEKRVDALINGFDDVVTTDTPLVEISARISGLIKRTSKVPNSFKLRICDLELDMNKRIVRRSGKIISLRKKEYEVLEYMLHHPEQVLSRERLLEHIWPNETFLFTNTVDVHVSAIRRKIDKDFEKKIIQTVHGVGYKISDDEKLY